MDTILLYTQFGLRLVGIADRFPVFSSSLFVDPPGLWFLDGRRPCQRPTPPKRSAPGQVHPHS
jgi:hypothetical protein